MEPKSKLRVKTLHDNPRPGSAAPVAAKPEQSLTRFLALDEEGYFVVDGLRVADVVIGLDWLSRIRMDDRGRAVLSGEPDLVIIEAFDQPLVALDVEVTSEAGIGPRLQARFPYGFQAELKADSLRVDEWDRFYARTHHGVPVVLNRSAQSRLFQQATAYDDDSVSFGDVTLQTRPLFTDFEGATEAAWWDDAFKRGDTPWDTGAAHQALDTLIPPLKMTRSRVLVIGCGAGHDAAWWAKRGHIVTGIDFSEDAIKKARETYGESESLKWVHADAFKLPAAWSSRFDLIFENLFFCAIPPSRREELIRVWWRLLSPRGRLVAFVPVMSKWVGPPYGSSEWELRKRLLESPQAPGKSVRRARFLPLLWNREKKSREMFLGSELFLVVERADSLTE